MSYTALYRRYRPQRFGELIGQEHISRVLAAAVRRDEPVHAYLFCGPRGTGKTSAARILARAVNCQHPTEDGDPCGLCPACQRDLAGESMDVIEIDGASNRGIDEIRDLRERVKYAPAQEKHKIYIIDEVHMLTDQAFNALLKTLEEPPAHVVFIFATTDPHKLPLTVISRCQRFDFRRISSADIEKHLLEVAAQENIPLSPEAAALIARKADGGMRDAVSLLDQCAGVCAGANDPEAQISQELVAGLLGVVDHSFVLRMLQALLAQDLTGVLAQVEELVQAGKDLRQALSDLQEVIRDTLLQLMAKDQSLPDWAKSASPGRYLALLQALSDTDNRMRFAPSPRISLELSLMKACGLAEEGPAAIASSAAAAPVKAPAAPPAAQNAAAAASSPAQAASASPMKASAPLMAPSQTDREAKKAFNSSPATAKQATVTTPVNTKPGNQPVATAPVAHTAGAAPPPLVPIEKLRSLWPEVLSRLEARNPGVAELLRDSRPDRVEGRVLYIDFPPGLELFMTSLSRDGQYKTMVENAVNSACRSSLSIQAFIGAARPKKQLEEDKAKQSDSAETDDERPPFPDEPPPEDQASLF